jgi:hypothetical protein
MSDLQFKCSICEADFRPGVLDKEGKCPSCQKEYPTVKNKAEALALNRPEINLGKKIDEATVRQIIREELNEFKAVLKAENEKAKQQAENLAKARAAKEDKKNDESEGGK